MGERRSGNDRYGAVLVLALVASVLVVLASLGHAVANLRVYS